jgi:hypothetical protein
MEMLNSSDKMVKSYYPGRKVRQSSLMHLEMQINELFDKENASIEPMLVSVTRK